MSKQGIYNLVIDKDGQTIGSQTHFAKNEQSDEKCVLHQVPHTETRCALLANLYSCEGKPGQVC